MSLKLQMIGTGNAFAKKFYNNNALLYCNDFTLLIDCGITAPRALYELNIPYDKIDGLLVTHLHADHVGGIEELAYQLMYKYKRKIKLFIPRSLVTKLWENTLKGGMDNPEVGQHDLSLYFDIVLLDEGLPYEIHQGLNIEIKKTDHVPLKDSYSLFINKDIFYSADVVFSRKLLDEVHLDRQCRLILHDCQLHSPGVVHAALKDLLTLPPDIQSKVRLMHYDDDMPNFVGKTGAMTFVEQHVVYVLQP